MRTLLSLLALALLLTSCSQDTSKKLKMTVGKDYLFLNDGMERKYKIYEPTKLAENAPMVFVLHGMNGNSTSAYLHGFNELAEQYGFLVVYPDSHQKLVSFDEETIKAQSSDKQASMEELLALARGKATNCQNGDTFRVKYLTFTCKDGLPVTYNKRWNSGNQDALFDGQSDVKFLTELAVSLQEQFKTSADKTFVAGFSNGGFMSYTLLCQGRNTFKAAGVVAGLIENNVLQSCPQKPQPIIHIHGVEDSMNPISGSEQNNFLDARGIVEHFANLNNSVRVQVRQVTQNTNKTVYLPESGGAEVQYYRIEKLDHIWPGGYNGGKKVSDESGINASKIIWDFFSKL